MEIVFSFARTRELAENVKQYEHRQKIDTFLDARQVNITPALRRMGVDIRQLKTTRLPCASLDQVDTCRRRAERRLNFGRLAPHVNSSWDSFETILVGKLNFTWKTPKGRLLKGTSKFLAPINLAVLDIDNPAELGAGGPIDPKLPGLMFTLKLDRENYRFNFPLRRPIKLKRRKLVAFGLKSTKSADALFRVVAVLSSGQKLVSKPIRLVYFKPRINERNSSWYE